jgi:hypothetical protein
MSETPDANEPVYPLAVPRRRTGDTSQLEANKSTGGTDARIAQSRAHGKVRLEILPYGRRNKGLFVAGVGVPITGVSVQSKMGVSGQCPRMTPPRNSTGWQGERSGAYNPSPTLFIMRSRRILRSVRPGQLFFTGRRRYLYSTAQGASVIFAAQASAEQRYPPSTGNTTRAVRYHSFVPSRCY